MWRDNDHLDSDRGAQQVDHLLVGQRGNCHFADLHKSTALSKPGLPSIAVGLHLCHNALEIHMKS